MESIQKIILIGGISASGKTTFARNLSDIIGIDRSEIISTDYIYFDIGKDLKIGNNFANLYAHKDFKYNKDEANKLKDKYYKKYLENHKENKFVIIEGYGLFIKKDREIIKSIFPNSEIIFLFKKANYQQWLENKNNHCTKLDCERTKQEYENTMNVYEKIGTDENIKSIIIK